MYRDAASTPYVRAFFLTLASGAAGYAVLTRGPEVSAAIQLLPLANVGLAALLSLAYVPATMMVWRALMLDLGTRFSLAAASRVFFVSQIGKYLPGGIWNVLAAAELGADHRIPRKRTISVMVIALLVALVTGLSLALATTPLLPQVAGWQPKLLIFLLPPLVCLLAPPVLNWLLELALRLSRRPPMQDKVTIRGVVSASTWSVASWLVAGLQVWLLARGVGLASGMQPFALSLSAYAVGWAAGLLVIVAPAGVGVREVVMGAVLANQLSASSVIVVVLLSRVMLTVADLVLGLLWLIRFRWPRTGQS